MVNIIIERYEPLPGERFYDDRFKLHNDKGTILSRPLVALDGEGKNDPQGIHHYTHFQALWPKGRRKLVKEHISTREMLHFIINLPPFHTYVIFAGNYDANMWLKDLLGSPSYVNLYTTGECDWQGYSIQWVENKYITIRKGKISRTIYDVFSWYQCSFVKACKSWEVGTEEQLERIIAMKERRGEFANVDPAIVEAYCWDELVLLSELVNKLREKILQTEYRLKGLYGPGALAAAILEREKVKDYYGDFDRQLALHAYYGGRFDTAFIGWFNSVFQHDIRSAYPDQIRYLPCLRHAHWERSNNPDISRYGFYHVRWSLHEDTPYPPFPWRDIDGMIYYPYKANGWYHADEVRAAKDIYKKQIKILEGEALIEDCDCRPFQFVEKLYAWRLRLQSEGNALQAIVVKLCLNSLYGKMAQSVGHRNKPPPFQNFFYAGAITSGTRAKILRAIGTGEKVISIATDGIVSRVNLDLPEGKQLGEWEIIEILNHVQLGNGIYLSINNQGERVEKSRGFGTKLLNYTKVREHILEHGPWGPFYYEGKTQFITLRQAYAQNRPEKACRWIMPENPPHIMLDSERRFQYDFNLAGKMPPYTDDDILQFARLPYEMKGLSAPFKPKQTWGEVTELRSVYFPEARTQD
jgi:hypothetical protein